MLRSLKRYAKAKLLPYVGQAVTAELWTSPVLRRRVNEELRDSPAIAGKVIPIDEGAPDVVVAASSADEVPLPPEELWEVQLDYLESGRLHVDTLRRILADHGIGREDYGDVLDFGCGAGRMIRWLADHAEDHEVWGADINAASITWAQQHLSPPFRFTPCSTVPHLPFEDDTFGLVYAVSVFTHISELADAWLLELRRVVRPGGVLYVTIQDRSYIDASLARGEDPEVPKMLERAAELDRLGDGVDMVALGRAHKGAQVFHDRDALVRKWDRFVAVLGVAEEAFYCQPAVIMRKRPR